LIRAEGGPVSYRAAGRSAPAAGVVDQGRAVAAAGSGGGLNYSLDQGNYGLLSACLAQLSTLT